VRWAGTFPASVSLTVERNGAETASTRIHLGVSERSSYCVGRRIYKIRRWKLSMDNSLPPWRESIRRPRPTNFVLLWKLHQIAAYQGRDGGDTRFRTQIVATLFHAAGRYRALLVPSFGREKSRGTADDRSDGVPGPSAKMTFSRVTPIGPYRSEPAQRGNRRGRAGLFLSPTLSVFKLRSTSAAATTSSPPASAQRSKPE
jgi:hypothetical protein